MVALLTVTEEDEVQILYLGPNLLGISQVVRHLTLIQAYGGSSPPSPANIIPSKLSR